MPRTFKKYKIIHSSSNLTKKNKIINKSDKKNKNKNKKITQNKFNLHGGSISIEGDDKKVYKIKKEKMEDFMSGNYELKKDDIVYFINYDNNNYKNKVNKIFNIDNKYYKNIRDAKNEIEMSNYEKVNMSDEKKQQILGILNDTKNNINKKIKNNDKITLDKLIISHMPPNNYNQIKLQNIDSPVVFIWTFKIFLIPEDFITEDIINISSLYDTLEEYESEYIIRDIFTDPTYFFYVEDEPKAPSKETPQPEEEKKPEKEEEKQPQPEEEKNPEEEKEISLYTDV